MTRTSVLLLGALFVAALFHAPATRAQVATGDLVITEIHFAPPTSANEFIEVLNTSDAAIDLQSVRYADGNLDADPVATEPTPLSPGARAVLVRNATAFERAFPGVPYLAPADWEALNNGGDLVLLQHESIVLDAVEYESSWGNREGASLERIDPAAPSQAFNFASSTAANGATPGAPNSVYAPDRQAPRAVFAEEMNPGVVDVLFSEDLHPSSEVSAQLDLGPGAEPGELQSVRLVAPAVLRLRHGRDAPPTTITIGGVQDLTGNRSPDARLPVARRPRPGEVVVNELLAAPRADDFDDRPNQPEYVEILNLTRDPLTLRGVALSDRPREDGTADTLLVGRRIALPPGGYAVIFAAADFFNLPDDSPDPSRTSLLAHSFPSAPLDDPSVALLPLDASSLGLRNREGVVRLHRADGLLLDGVSYDARWHADALEDPTGTSLERVSPTASSSAPDNWRSSTARHGGTPGSPNAAALSVPPSSPSAAGIHVSPSPFSPERNGAARIRYTLAVEVSVVRVRIFDALGRRVRTLTDARLSGRQGELVWNGRGDDGKRLRVGIYVVLLDAVDAEGGTVERHKSTVVLARPLG